MQIGISELSPRVSRMTITKKKKVISQACGRVKVDGSCVGFEKENSQKNKRQREQCAARSVDKNLF